MRRKRTVCCILIIVFVVFACQLTAFARAGGGGGGSHSSGGSSLSGGSAHSGYGNSSGRGGLISSVIQGAGFAVIACAGTIVFVYKVHKAKRATKKQIGAFAKEEENWEYKELQKRVEEAYFEVQECWRRKDVNYAKDYLSKNLMVEFQMKIGWMDVRNEEVVQKEVTLLGADLLDAHNEKGEDADYVWYLIHGKMIGYYVDKDTKLIVRGSAKPESFYEYWKFVREDGRWVLDKIKQKNEISIDQFIDL